MFRAREDSRIGDEEFKMHFHLPHSVIAEKLDGFYIRGKLIVMTADILDFFSPLKALRSTMFEKYEKNGWNQFDSVGGEA